jgi:hypothetical protein
LTFNFGVRAPAIKMADEELKELDRVHDVPDEPDYE